MLAAAATVPSFVGVSQLGRHSPTSAEFLLPTGVGLVALVALVVSEYRSSHPVLAVRAVAHTLPVIGICNAMLAGAGFTLLTEVAMAHLSQVERRSPWSVSLAMSTLVLTALLLAGGARPHPGRARLGARGPGRPALAAVGQPAARHTRPGERRCVMNLGKLRDDDLADAATRLLRHDSRLPALKLDVHSDGGVLHLTGAVDTAKELAAARELLGRVSGVLAVWDRVRVGGRAPTALDLGFGATPQHPDNIGVDTRPTDPVDIRADLRGGLLFRTAGADRIFAVHVLEHVPNYLPLVDECHRVLRPGGILHVLCPWWRHVNAVADPTHLRLLDVQTMKGICARPGSDRRWYPLHAARDEATVFADLTPLAPGDPAPDPHRMARFFD